MRALARVIAGTLLSAGLVGPLHDGAVASDNVGPVAAPVAVRADALSDHPSAPAPKGFTDDAARVSFDPPADWVRARLNAGSSTCPPSPSVLVATSARIRVARSRPWLSLRRPSRSSARSRPYVLSMITTSAPSIIDEERTYEGLHVFTRYFVARETDRRLVMRAVTADESWAALAPVIRASFDSFRADPNGPNAPAAPPPPAPVVEQPAPEAAAPPPDASLVIRQAILDRAAAMLSTPYVWGGNSPGRGMDCSAYVSAAWGVARYTTESIGWVSFPIGKEDLRSGDAMNMQIGRDPEGFGHLRLFEAWANEAHTLVWVYEETPPRAVHRVVVYDDRYQPIRLAGLSNAGLAPLRPAPLPAPTPRLVPTQPRPVTPTVRPTYRPRTPIPTRMPVTTRTPVPLGVTPSPRPTTTPAPTATVRPLRTPTPTASIRR